jgi:hypothetical protein
VAVFKRRRKKIHLPEGQIGGVGSPKGGNGDSEAPQIAGSGGDGRNSGSGSGSGELTYSQSRSSLSAVNPRTRPATLASRPPSSASHRDLTRPSSPEPRFVIFDIPRAPSRASAGSLVSIAELPD